MRQNKLQEFHEQKTSCHNRELINIEIDAILNNNAIHVLYSQICVSFIQSKLIDQFLKNKEFDQLIENASACEETKMFDDFGWR